MLLAVALGGLVLIVACSITLGITIKQRCSVDKNWTPMPESLFESEDYCLRGKMNADAKAWNKE
jgi:hypothetical protein